LGIESTGDRFEFTEVIKNNQIIKIARGAWHGILYLRNGDCLAYGERKQGKL
jgi:alpha-tubulin suppressor-like RCC1 family protein